MNDESGALTPALDESIGLEGRGHSVSRAGTSRAAGVPDYLSETYWWAYLHPNAVRFWEREWLVNAILWGQMNRLTDAVISELNLAPCSNLLQIACVYGNFSNRLAEHSVRHQSRFHVLDIAPIQLANARRKLAGIRSVSFHLQDSSSLQFPDQGFEHAVLYFLLHEQPEEVRRKTLREALRVVKPGGKVVVVDYHRPRWWNGLRVVMWPVLHTLEPFAMDLWRQPVESWLDPGDWSISTKTYCGGLYQKTVIQRS